MNKQPRKLHDEVPVMRETKLTKQISEDDEKFKRYENELSQPLPPILFWHKITFVFLGIASLAGWNAILTAFDFFSVKYPKGEFLDVTFYFPIPIMITNSLLLIPPILNAIFCMVILDFKRQGDCF